jgi:hypothetical protein
MEFGTTPLPLGREETFRRGKLFDTPAFPRAGKRQCGTCFFAFTLPSHIHSIENVEAVDDRIVLHGEEAGSSFSIPAHGCEEFPSEGEQLAVQ